MLVLESEEQVRSVVPNQSIIKGLDGVCLHITAKGNNFDCVTRTFASKCGVAEDPLCGRGHCHVIPLWADRLKKQSSPLIRLLTVEAFFIAVMPGNEL